MSEQGCEQLMLFPVDSHASHSVRPGSAEARRMTVTSGQRCSELYRNSGPLGWLVKTLLESSQWRSTRCYLTWKISTTPSRRLLFRLAPSMPRTDETDVQFWPTPTSMDAAGLDHYPRKDATPTRSVLLSQKVALWPTPTARDCKGANSMEHLTREGKRNHTDQLANAVKLFPTPTVRCGTGPSQTATRQGSSDLQTEIGGQLNPTWVEWLMGFPAGWTDLDASGTP